MKKNIKKLAVCTMVVGIAMFMLVAIASAGDRHSIPNAIKGKYAGTAINQCTTAMGGFAYDKDLNNWTPIGDLWSAGTNTTQSVYTFNPDGTGSLEGPVSMMSLPGGTNMKPIGSFVPSSSYRFTYTVTDQGFITFTVVPGTFEIAPGVCLDSMPRNGAISGDGKTIVMECGPPNLANLVLCDDQTPLGPQILCVFSSVLVKLRGQGGEDD